MSIVRLVITHGASVITDITGSGQQAGAFIRHCGELVHAAQRLELPYKLTEDGEERSDDWLMWAGCDR